MDAAFIKSYNNEERQDDISLLNRVQMSRLKSKIIHECKTTTNKFWETMKSKGNFQTPGMLTAKVNKGSLVKLLTKSFDVTHQN